MIRVSSQGSFKKTLTFLTRIKSREMYRDLNSYGQRGVEALKAATPKKSGDTAAAWRYKIQQSSAGVTIVWTNSNVNNGKQIALLIQYGHGTGTGGYVSGIDYINPAIRPVFDKIAEDVWKKVTSA